MLVYMAKKSGEITFNIEKGDVLIQFQEDSWQEVDIAFTFITNLLNMLKGKEFRGELTEDGIEYLRGVEDGLQQLWDIRAELLGGYQ